MAGFGGKDHLELMAGSSEYKRHAQGRACVGQHRSCVAEVYLRELPISKKLNMSHSDINLNSLSPLPLSCHLLSLYAVGFSQLQSFTVSGVITSKSSQLPVRCVQL